MTYQFGNPTNELAHTVATMFAIKKDSSQAIAFLAKAIDNKALSGILVE